MRGAVDGHENAEQLAERKPHAMPGIGTVAELVGHAFAECRGQRHGDHGIADLHEQPEHDDELQEVAYRQYRQ